MSKSTSFMASTSTVAMVTAMLAPTLHEAKIKKRSRLYVKWILCIYAAWKERQICIIDWYFLKDEQDFFCITVVRWTVLDTRNPVQWTVRYCCTNEGHWFDHEDNMCIHADVSLSETLQPENNSIFRLFYTFTNNLCSVNKAFCLTVSLNTHWQRDVLSCTNW